MTEHHDDHQADPPRRKLTKAECGRLGGNTTKARHGREHYVRAGKLGFAKLVGNRFGGGRTATVAHLIAAGKLAGPGDPEASAAALRRLHAQATGQQEAPDHD
jgi:hypothetical protein